MPRPPPPCAPPDRPSRIWSRWRARTACGRSVSNAVSPVKPMWNSNTNAPARKRAASRLCPSCWRTSARFPTSWPSGRVAGSNSNPASCRAAGSARIGRWCNPRSAAPRAASRRPCPSAWPIPKVRCQSSWNATNSRISASSAFPKARSPRWCPRAATL